MKKKSMWILCLLMVVSLLAGCGEKGTPAATGKEDGNPVAIDEKPVTLKLMQFSTPLTDEDFKIQIADPVKKKYPNITVELIHAPSGFTPEKMLASGDVPDIMFTGSRQIPKFIDVQFPLDLTPLAKKLNVDTGVFDPMAIDFIKQYGNNGALFAFPFSLGWSALYYNKDIFDKFGVPYPADSMTWDQAIELGQKLARTDGSVTYTPLNAGSFTDLASPLQIVTVNPATLKVDIDNDRYRKAMEVFKKITGLPGNKNSFGNGQNKFYKDKTMAMEPDFNGLMDLIIESVKGGNSLNWDVTTYPGLEGAPNRSKEQIIQLFMVYSKTKYPDQAMQALNAITSDENQLNISRNGKLAALKDPKYKQNFGADVPELKGKHLQSIFKSTPSPAQVISLYENSGRDSLNAVAKQVASGQMDINTALRTAQQDAEKKVADAAGK
jgi:multiple sugar transport system substrate-binding protein